MMDKSLLASTDRGSIYRLMPDLVVVKIGGQSIIDRGREALLPILDELVEARQSHKILITTGGGTRARHAYAIATDLGYSMLMNRFGKAGAIPEGMCATTALRTQDYMGKHDAIGKRLEKKADQYKKEHGYEAPYWGLVNLARQAKTEI